MKKDNIIIYVSSKNNYDMFGEEVLKNINTEGFEIINIDDNSSEQEIKKGKQICKDNDIVFLENKSVGVQMATQTLVDFINENRPDCKWIFCFQHDNYPISENFFGRISKLINDNKLNDFGALGFNVIDMGKYCGNAFIDFQNHKKPFGMLGLCHLSIHNESGRWLSPHHNQLAIRNRKKWDDPFIIEMPMWAAVGINVQKWNEVIEPTDEYQFHLWFPDIMMQFNYHNSPCLILPNLYCINRQELKEKYDIPVKSTVGNEHYFGEYGPHLKVFKERWGWDYRNVKFDFEQIKENYKDTLLLDYFNHDVNMGPLKAYFMGDY